MPRGGRYYVGTFEEARDFIYPTVLRKCVLNHVVLLVIPVVPSLKTVKGIRYTYSRLWFLSRKTFVAMLILFFTPAAGIYGPAVFKNLHNGPLTCLCTHTTTTVAGLPTEEI